MPILNTLQNQTIDQKSVEAESLKTKGKDYAEVAYMTQRVVSEIKMVQIQDEVGERGQSRQRLSRTRPLYSRLFNVL